MRISIRWTRRLALVGTLAFFPAAAHATGYGHGILEMNQTPQGDEGSYGTSDSDLGQAGYGAVETAPVAPVTPTQASSQPRLQATGYNGYRPQTRGRAAGYSSINLDAAARQQGNYGYGSRQGYVTGASYQPGAQASGGTRIYRPDLGTNAGAVNPGAAGGVYAPSDIGDTGNTNAQGAPLGAEHF